jgi:DNA-binding MarR family transcriptional regulator
MKAQDTVDYHIKLTWHSIVNLYNHIAFQHNLTQATGFVLINIDKSGSPATSIAPLMGMKATSLSRILKNMETDGLICRKKDKSDGRLVKIYLTELGVAKQKIAKKVVREFNQYILKNIDPKKIDCYREVMGDILSLTEEYSNKKLS